MGHLKGSPRDVVLVLLVAVAFFLVWHQGRQIKGIAHGNMRLTMTQCHRTREFSPSLAGFYEQHHALSAAQLHDYRATIPKRC